MKDFTKSNLCHLPWTGMDVLPQGEYKPCCLYKHKLKHKGNVLNVKNNTIDEAINSDDMQALRREFLENKRPNGCQSCWLEEDAGKKSKRIMSWEKMPVLGDLHVKKDIKSVRFLGLKLGNICNLKCRICSAENSSLWAAETAKYNQSLKHEMIQINKQSKWPREKNQLFDQLHKVIHDVRYIDFTGGEPFMIQEQFDVLKECVRAGVAHKIELHYNTNGTIYPEKAIDEIWPHFKRVELAFSIDDIGKRFEYQRHPADWLTVKNNIEKITRSGLDNLSTQVCTTLSVFNIYYLDELAEKIQDWNLDFWYISSLTNPIEFDVRNLPKVVKKIITEKLETSQTGKKEIVSALKLMDSSPDRGSQHILANTLHEIRRLDDIRKQDFKQTFPEMHKIFENFDKQ